ncbi:MAG: DUF5947 family protein [Vulcanimicrobiaceae bacterium]
MGEPGFADLQRFLRARPPAAPGERCDYCAVPIAEGHGHLVDLEARRILCSCRPCYLVFEPAGAARGRYRTIPSRYERIADFAIDEASWDDLQIPIALAFFFRNSRENRWSAFYPGPAGATESQLTLAVWDALAAAYPALATVAPDVEAVLVHRRDDLPSRCAIVPIDAAYELVGVMRTHWRGFDGGPDVRARIEAFFADIDERCDGRAVARWR